MKLVVGVLVALAGCAADDPRPSVRARNGTDSDMTDVTWGGYRARSLAPAACTSYVQPTPPVYRYTRTSFTIDGVQYGTVFDDSPGVELGDGRFSYRLTIAEPLSGHVANIELVPTTSSAPTQRFAGAAGVSFSSGFTMK